MSALGKMTRIIDIAAHAPAMARPDLGRRRRIGPILTKGSSSGKIDGKQRLEKCPTNYISLSLVSATRPLSTRHDKLKFVEHRIASWKTNARARRFSLNGDAQVASLRTLKCSLLNPKSRRKSLLYMR
jgi:hypothetical protein